MKIVQLLSDLVYGDAVSNDAIAMGKLILSMGYETVIYASWFDEHIEKVCAVDYYYNMPRLSSDDVLIYHFSTGNPAMKKVLQELKCHKIMVYHNITPAEYFASYNPDIAKSLVKGREDLQAMHNIFEYCLAVSEFNKVELQKYGYTCPIIVLPIIIPMQDYDKSPDGTIINNYTKDGWTNIIFVGRVVPNKKQEDLIKAFTYYKKHINSKSRLFIVGNHHGMEIYLQRLQQYVENLQVKDVIFTGKIPFAQILAYYTIADVFLCTSEHEGFCVPLIEAMKFGVPIVAYGAGAIPETLGGAGILVGNKDAAYLALIIDKLVKDEQFKKNIVAGQNLRLQDFSYERTSDRFKKILNAMLKQMSEHRIDSINIDLLEDAKAVHEDTNLQTVLEDIKIASQQAVDKQDVSFSNIKLQQQKSLSGIIKQKVLRPGYELVSALNPALANNVRSFIFHTVGKFKHTNEKLILKDAVGEREQAILVDVTQATELSNNTGIQRVVRNVVAHAQEIEKKVLPIREYDGKLISATKFLALISNTTFNNTEAKIELKTGDKLLFLDSSWAYYADFEPIIDKAHEEQIPVFTVIYDLFPIKYPELFGSKSFVDMFETWLKLALQKSDAIVCISKTTADVVLEYLLQYNFERTIPLNLFYFHMGSDINKDISRGIVRDNIQEFVCKKRTLLMVGTVEPRKGHLVVVNAMRKLTEAGVDIQLLVMGKNGWENEEFSRALSDKTIADKILWIQDASDAEIAWVYQNVTALIAASKDEGFGLPLIEAASYGLPIICSEIPIFKEVATDNATYFKSMDAESLKSSIEQWLSCKVHPDSRKIKLYTWKDSTQELLDIIAGKMKPYKTY